MIEGCCYCGAVRWRLDGPLESATICNCTACRRSGAIRGFVYEGQDIALTAPDDDLIRYVRGDRLLEVLSCRACGNPVGWRSLQTGVDGRHRMAVNLRLAEPATVFAIR